MGMGEFAATLWAIIGVLLLAVLGGILVIGGVSLIRSLLARRRSAIVVGEDSNASEREDFDFGKFQPIKGTAYLMSPYGPTPDYKGSLTGYGGEGVRNYLFVSRDDQSCRYLMPTHHQIVLHLETLGAGASERRSAPVRWLYLHIIDTDTNGDGRLTLEDGFSVAFADSDGSELKSLIPGVDRVYDRAWQSDEKMLLFYKKQEKFWMSEVHIAERSVVRTQEIPTLPSSSPKVRR